MPDETPDIDTTATTEVAPEKSAPKSIEELVAGIDISDVTLEQIFRELIGAIQNVAITAQIALGIAERVKIRDLAAASSAKPAPEVVTPELEVV